MGRPSLEAVDLKLNRELYAKLELSRGTVPEADHAYAQELLIWAIQCL